MGFMGKLWENNKLFKIKLLHTSLRNNKINK